jgi:2-oxo-4-hydroxy-4-carboxy-5-ureidoimidazoline decarboxylase
MIPLDELNTLPLGEFIAALDGIFEHSPWVAARIADLRPFASLDALHGAMVAAVARAGRTAQLALLRAHPTLARPAPLTQASAAEQASLGLTSLAQGEADQFAALNQDYQERFGFPFIIAVRGQRDRMAILASLRARLVNGAAEESATALAEIAKIARFRLDDRIAEGKPT